MENSAPVYKTSRAAGIQNFHAWTYSFHFPPLDRRFILTAEHMYSGSPGDRFSGQGSLKILKINLVFTLDTVLLKQGLYY